jgi:hypothetical protein
MVPTFGGKLCSPKVQYIVKTALSMRHASWQAKHKNDQKMYVAPEFTFTFNDMFLFAPLFFFHVRRPFGMKHFLAKTIPKITILPNNRFS